MMCLTSSSLSFLFSDFPYGFYCKIIFIKNPYIRLTIVTVYSVPVTYNLHSTLIIE